MAGGSLLAFVAGARAQPTGAARPPDPVGQVMAAYIADPVGMKPRMLELARGGLEGLPFPVLLAITDALLRDGQASAARAVAETYPERGGSAEVTEKVLAWVAFVSGDLRDARTRYAVLAANGTEVAIANTIVALIDAAGGHTQSALRTLEDVRADATAPPILHQVSQLGSAYAYLWTRDYANAERAFLTTADAFPESRLTDDARYGAALAAFRRGDEERATTALEELAGPGRGPSRASRELLNLRPGAILRAGRRHFGRAPFLVPADAIAALLDVNGATLARAALRRVEEKGTPTGEDIAPMERAAPTASPGDAGAAATHAGGHTAGTTPPPGPSGSAPSPATNPVAPEGTSWAWAFAFVGAVLVAFVWLRGRGSPSTPQRRRR